MNAMLFLSKFVFDHPWIFQIDGSAIATVVVQAKASRVTRASCFIYEVLKRGIIVSRLVESKLVRRYFA